MGTYADVFNRIADELGGRTDLLANSTGMSTPPIQLAILDAVNLHQSERFWFNEYRTASAFSTVSGQEFYTSSDWADLATILHIDKISVLISGNRYYMEARTEEYMEDVSLNPNVLGNPEDYSYYNFRLRLYPIPDGAYPMNVLGSKHFTALSANSDANVWTTEAEGLIRAQAKKFLYRDTLMDDVGAARMDRAIAEQLTSLRAQTMRRVPVRKMRATYF